MSQEAYEREPIKPSESALWIILILLMQGLCVWGGWRLHKQMHPEPSPEFQEQLTAALATRLNARETEVAAAYTRQLDDLQSALDQCQNASAKPKPAVDDPDAKPVPRTDAPTLICEGGGFYRREELAACLELYLPDEKWARVDMIVRRHDAGAGFEGMPTRYELDYLYVTAQGTTRQECQPGDVDCMFFKITTR